MAPPEFNRIQNSVTINNPFTNQSFNPGDIVPVDISTNNGVNRIVLEGISYPDSSNFVDTFFINGTVNYRIPTHARGNEIYSYRVQLQQFSWLRHCHNKYQQGFSIR